MNTDSPALRVLDVTPSDVQQRLARGEKLNIIDVRTHDEVAEGIIPEARHIPLFELPDILDTFDPEAETIFVCRSGRRSTAVCQVLMLQGFHNVKNLAGGMLAWKGHVSYA